MATSTVNPTALDAIASLGGLAPSASAATRQDTVARLGSGEAASRSRCALVLALASHWRVYKQSTANGMHLALQGSENLLVPLSECAIAALCLLEETGLRSAAARRSYSGRAFC